MLPWGPDQTSNSKVGSTHLSRLWGGSWLAGVVGEGRETSGFGFPHQIKLWSPTYFVLNKCFPKGYQGDRLPFF